MALREALCEPLGQEPAAVVIDDELDDAVAPRRTLTRSASACSTTLASSSRAAEKTSWSCGWLSCEERSSRSSKPARPEAC